MSFTTVTARFAVLGLLLIGLAAPQAARAQSASLNNIIIREFRLDGPSGLGDEFYEIVNLNDASIVIAANDQSSGWSVGNSRDGGEVIFVIPNGTIIPGRGRYLAVSTTSTIVPPPGDLDDNPDDDPDQVFGAGTTPTNAGIALFRTSNPQNYSLQTRQDAVGSSSEPNTLFREGAGYAPFGSVATGTQFSLVRKETTGASQDTGDNARDFELVSTTGETIGGRVSILGFPSPEPSTGPGQHNDKFTTSMIEPNAAQGQSPNRVRTGSGNSGTIALRRRFTNNSTFETVERLQFRVINITTLNSPGYTPGGPQADVRPTNSGDAPVTTSLGTLTVRGTTLKLPPGTVTTEGGLNSVLTVTLPDGGLAPGQSVDVQFLLNVRQGGSFRFFVNIEALFAPPVVDETPPPV